MRTLFLCLNLFIGICAANAQLSLSNSRQPVKLTDAIKFYKQYVQPSLGLKMVKEENLKIIDRWQLNNLLKTEENKDYQFERWQWYWRQHLDSKGNMVGPIKTWREWEKMQQNKKGKTNQRISSGTPTWVFQGPDSSGAFTGDGAGAGIGRINVVSFHPTDTNTFWIGSPGGGAWRTRDNGNSWTCMTDMLPSLGVSDITFNPHNPNTIYLCTGDRDAWDTYGIGILKSYNGGTTWLTTVGWVWSDSNAITANTLLVNPLDTNSLILGTNIGIFRSFTGGNSWIQTDTGNFKQIVYRPNDTNIVYATKYNYWSYDTTWTLHSAQIKRSSDGGMTWNQVTNFTNSQRITLAVTPANPKIVKAISSSASNSGLDGIFSSNDTGHTFTKIFSGTCDTAFGTNLLDWDTGYYCGGQGWYSLPLAISPIHENEMYTGGVNGWYSTDSGHHWTMLSQWTPGVIAGSTEVVHADKHFMAFNPLQANKLYETNDGGIYCAYNPSTGGVWKNRSNGLGITEFYRIATSNIANFTIGGAQDVGTKLVRPHFYEEACGGDGMACQLDNVDSNIGYASSQTGYINRIIATDPSPSNTGIDISANIDGGNAQGNGAWITPYIIEPSCHTCLLAGYQKVYRTTDTGNTWVAISDSLTQNYLSRVVMSIADSNTIFAVDSWYDSIFYTHNLGSTWNHMIGPDIYHTISDIKIDPRDANHIWITMSGYGGMQVAEWRPSTGWTQINAGLPDVPVNCIAFDNWSRDMYVGTDLGVFYRDSTMSTWQPYGAGLPAVHVVDLDISYSRNELWAGTYGRSMWKTSKNSITTVEVSIVPFAPDAVTVAPNPNNGSFNVILNNISNNTVNFNLTDILGRTVWQEKNIVYSGAPLRMNTAGLIPGNYLLTVSNGSNVIGKQKIIIN